MATAMLSSPIGPPIDTRPTAWNVFDSRPLPPSSMDDDDDDDDDHVQTQHPSSEHDDPDEHGALSPSLDASFASSMSISSSGPPSSHMVVSPVLSQEPPTPSNLAPAFDSSFFAKLSSNQPSRSRRVPDPPTAFSPIASSPISPYPDSPLDRLGKPFSLAAANSSSKQSSLKPQRVFGTNLSPNAPERPSLLSKPPILSSSSVSSNSIVVPPPTSHSASSSVSSTSSSSSSSKSSHHRANSDGITLKSSKRPRDHSSRRAPPPPPLPLHANFSNENTDQQQTTSCTSKPATSFAAFQSIPFSNNLQPPPTFARHNTQPVFSGQGNWAALDVFKKNQSPCTAPLQPQTSSPAAMDVDSSPHLSRNRSASQSSPNTRDAFLQEAFNDPSPIPATKKRLLYNDQHSPHTSSPLSQQVLAARPNFEKANTMNYFDQSAPTTAIGSGLFGGGPSRKRVPRRPSLVTAPSLPSGARPSYAKSCRTRSVNGVSVFGVSQEPKLYPVDGSPLDLHSSAKLQSNNDSSHSFSMGKSPSFRRLMDNCAGGAASTDNFTFGNAGACQEPIRNSPERGLTSPSAFKFASESEGKILPCFSVKDDGLMRIRPNTLSDLLEGRYDSLVKDYVIIDCRFEYEYSGGHFRGAVNLPTQEAVEEHLLRNGKGYHATTGESLPQPSKSGEPDSSGNTRKTVLIFHCEFSTKRAPTLAKHLRHLDRKVNSKVYPRVHYPDVYILSGGYAESFRQYPQLCEPCGYRPMDDPEFLAKRSAELNEFRKARMGVRARSFTFGERGSQQNLSSRPQSNRPNSFTKTSTTNSSMNNYQSTSSLSFAVNASSALASNTGGAMNVIPANSSNPACRLRRLPSNHSRTSSNAVVITNPTITEETEIVAEHENEHDIHDESSFVEDSPCMRRGN